MLNRLYINITIIFILSICSVACVAHSNDQQLQPLWKQYQVEGDNEKKLPLLFAIGDKYLSVHQPQQRDSVFELALASEYVQLGGNDLQLMNIYNWYFSKEYAAENKNALDYAGQMEKLGENNNNDGWLYDAYCVYYKIYIAQSKPSIALGYITKANYYANILNNDTLKIESLLASGDCREKNNSKLEAFKNYRDALYIASNMNDDSLLYESYGDLSFFFRVMKNFEKSKEYKQKQFSMLLKQTPVDSSKLMWLYDDLSNILFDSKEGYQGEKILKQEIDYALRRHDDGLRIAGFTIYRTYLIDNGLFAELSSLYTKQYPEELVKIAQNNPGLYYRLMAFIKESDKELDSSAYYYQLAENVVKESSDNIFISNFYRRYGQFLLRKGDTALARTKFELSYNNALQARYFPYIIDATKYLDSINYNENNIAIAYQYEKQNRAYTDSQATVAKENELMLMEIDNENKQHEINVKKRKAALTQKHNLQDISILIFITALFIVLAMLGSFKAPKFVIKGAGFLSFILLFEFIVMMTDTTVENYTKGEPWKILLFKLFIISILAPIHHWMEHKLITYLSEHKLIDRPFMKLKPMIAGIIKKTKAPEPQHKEQEHKK